MADKFKIEDFFNEKGELLVDLEKTGARKFVVGWIREQLELMRSWHEKGELKGKTAPRKLLPETILLKGKDGAIDKARVSNITKYFEGKPGGGGLENLTKAGRVKLNRLLNELSQTLDPLTPTYSSLKPYAKWIGHIHHRVPLAILQSIIERVARITNPDWKLGDEITPYTKVFLKHIQNKFNITTGDDIRNLDFIPKEKEYLHTKIHQIWDEFGITKNKVAQAMKEIPSHANAGVQMTQIVNYFDQWIKPLVEIAEETVGDFRLEAAKEATSGQIGALWRKVHGKVNKKNLARATIGLGTGIAEIGRQGLALGLDTILDKDVAGALGHADATYSNPLSTALQKLEAKKRLLKETWKAAGINVAIAGTLKFTGTGAALSKLTPIAPAALTYAGINAYDAFLKERTGEDLSEHYSKFKDKRAPLSDKIEAGDRLKAEPSQGEWGQGKKLNPIESIGQEIKNRSALYKERFNPREGEWGLSELLYGR